MGDPYSKCGILLEAVLAEEPFSGEAVVQPSVEPAVDSSQVREPLAAGVLQDTCVLAGVAIIIVILA